MPTMRSPGTAPPSAKLTGRSPRKPLIGMPFGACGRSLRLLLDPGQRNLRPITLPRPNQPSSARFDLAAPLGVLARRRPPAQTARITSADAQLAAADGGDHILGGLLRQARERLSHGVLAEGLAPAAETRVTENLAAELAVLGAHRVARGPPDGRARLAGDGEALPGRRRRLHLGA